MMLDAFTTLLTGFGLGAALIMAIGAQNLFVLRQGLKREHVGAVVLFCALADATLIALGVGGAGAFLSAVPQLSFALALGGAAFLGWHALAAFRRMADPGRLEVTAGGEMSLARALATTAGFTFLNPHVYLDTVLLMGAAGASQPEPLRPVFVVGAAAASFVWFGALGYGARLLAPVFARPSAWRLLDAVVGIIMASLAISLAIAAVDAAG